MDKQEQPKKHLTIMAATQIQFFITGHYCAIKTGVLIIRLITRFMIADMWHHNILLKRGHRECFGTTLRWLTRAARGKSRNPMTANVIMPPLMFMTSASVGQVTPHHTQQWLPP